MFEWKRLRWLRMLPVFLVAAGLVFTGCGKDDDDGDGGPSGPSDGDGLPATFIGTWYRVAMQYEETDSVTYNYDELRFIDFDENGDYEWYVGDSRIRYGRTEWKVIDDTTYLNIYKTEGSGMQTLFDSVIVEHHDEDFTWLLMHREPRNETWYMVKGGNCIAGLVNLAYNCVPLPEAQLSLVHGENEIASGSANSKGLYLLKDITPPTEGNSYTLNVIADDYESRSSSVEQLNETAPVFRSFSMTLAAGDVAVVSGTVTDSENSDPMYLATVEDDRGNSVETDSSGHYSLTVDAGLRILSATRTGWMVERDTLLIDPQEQYTNDFALARNPNVTLAILLGTVTHGETGDPILGARIRMDGELFTTTDSSGFYRFEPEAGQRSFSIVKSGFETHTEDVELDAGEIYRFDRELFPEVVNDSGTVYGQVKDGETNVIIADAIVVSDHGDMVTTDSLGFYSLRVKTGNRTISASKQGYDEESYQVEVTAGAQVNHNFLLFPEGSGGEATVNGRVTDAETSDPVPGATVQCDDGSRTTTGNDGYYNLTIRTGDRTITASAEDYQTGYETLTGLVDGQEVTVNFSLTPSGGGGGGQEANIGYDNGQANRRYVNPGGSMGVQMSPEEPCQVLRLYYGTGPNAGNPFNAEVWSWADGQPGTRMHSSPASTLADAVQTVDIESANIHVNGDFVVAFGSLNETAGLLGHDGFTTGRSWITLEGAWQLFEPMFIIRCTVRYPDGTMVTLSPSAPTGLKNVTAGELLDISR